MAFEVCAACRRDACGDAGMAPLTRHRTRPSRQAHEYTVSKWLANTVRRGQLERLGTRLLRGRATQSKAPDSATGVGSSNSACDFVRHLCALPVWDDPGSLPSCRLPNPVDARPVVRTHAKRTARTAATSGGSLRGCVRVHAAAEDSMHITPPAGHRPRTCGPGR